MNNWIVFSLSGLALWSTYLFFGNRATEVHGPKVTMGFEGVAMLLIGVLACATSIGDFSRVTRPSFTNASIMGLMSAGGLFLQLVAMQRAPDKIPQIAMITGMWPVMTVLLEPLMVPGKIFLAKNIVAAILAVSAMALISI